MADVEPIIVVLGPFGGGTSAVAGVLRDLGVFMGRQFDWAWREPHETWEDSRISKLVRRAFTVPGGRLQMDAADFTAMLRDWAEGHREAASNVGQVPGVKQPLLCAALNELRDAWGPVIPVVVERPVGDAVATLNRLGWWADEQERTDSTTHLVAERDRALAGTAPITVDFNELRAEPDAVVRRLAADLGLSVTETQVEAAVAGILQPADVGTGDPYGEDLLLARVERNPDDHAAINLLCQLYYDMLDEPAKARDWYARWLEARDGSPEVIYQALYRLAELMDRLGEPWPEVRDAYQRAWEFRPTRAEPLYAIAHRYRIDGHCRLGHLFAGRAAVIAYPQRDLLIEQPDVYVWRARDEQAVCASQLGEHPEAFALFRQLLAQPDLPDVERPRMANNRDFSVPAMLAQAAPYPETKVAALTKGSPDAEVTVSLIAGPDRADVEQTLNSFVNCCTDIARVGRFLAVDAGLSPEDRAALGERYGFVEFVDAGPATDPAAQLALIRRQVGGRFWLHLGRGWRFFAPEDLITRLTAVLDAEPQVLQVGVNFTDATGPTGSCATGETVRRAPGAGRYLLGDTVATGPAMVDTTRLDRVVGPERADTDPLTELRRHAGAAGPVTATLDEVLCTAAL